MRVFSTLKFLTHTQREREREREREESEWIEHMK